MPDGVISLRHRALLADVHTKLPAAEAVMVCVKEGDKWVFYGDLSPTETTELQAQLAKNTLHRIRGGEL